MTKYYVPDGLRCVYCGTVFAREDSLEPHPPALEFINGYPSPCRKIGETVNTDWFIFSREGAIPWIASNVKLVTNIW